MINQHPTHKPTFEIQSKGYSPTLMWSTNPTLSLDEKQPKSGTSLHTSEQLKVYYSTGSLKNQRDLSKPLIHSIKLYSLVSPLSRMHYTIPQISWTLVYPKKSKSPDDSLTQISTIGNTLTISKLHINEPWVHQISTQEKERLSLRSKCNYQVDCLWTLHLSTKIPMSTSRDKARRSTQNSSTKSGRTGQSRASGYQISRSTSSTQNLDRKSSHNNREESLSQKTRESSKVRSWRRRKWRWTLRPWGRTQYRQRQRAWTWTRMWKRTQRHKRVHGHKKPTTPRGWILI